MNSLQGPLHLQTAVLFQPPPPPWLPQVPRAELGVRTGWVPARLGVEVPAGRLPVPSLCLLSWPLCCGRSLQTGGQVKLFPDHRHHRQPAPRPLQPADDGMPPGTAGRPREPSPHRPQPRCVCGRWAWAGGDPEQVFIGPSGAECVWAPVSSLDRNWRMVFSDSLLHLQTLRERDEQGWKCGGRPGQTEAVSALAGRGAQGCRTGSSPLEGLPAPAEKIPSLHGLLVSAWGSLGYHVTSLVASSVKCRSWTSPHQAQKLQDSLAKAMM